VVTSSNVPLVLCLVKALHLVYIMKLDCVASLWLGIVKEYYCNVYTWYKKVKACMQPL
jgi:hypothetical protein